MQNKFTEKLLHGWSEPNVLTFLLLPLSLFYRSVMVVRKLFYSKNFFGVYQAKVPVLVVGNISVGGTGKTPLTMAVVERARSLGFKPGVISRGYGGQALEWPQQVTAATSAHYVGDESVLIARSTNCPVVVGPKRSAAIDLLLSEHDCDLIISDDGLQHYALARNAEIAVIDQQRRHLNQFCLPAGPLREPQSRLKSVDLILNHVAPVEREEKDPFNRSEENLFRLKNKGFVNVSDNQPCDLANSGKVHAVAGIGHPLRFFRLLRALGFDVIEHAFPDHHRFVAEDFDFGDNLTVIMTAKDAVKCVAFARPNWHYLSVEAELNVNASKSLDALLNKLTTTMFETISSKPATPTSE